MSEIELELVKIRGMIESVLSLIMQIDQAINRVEVIEYGRRDVKHENPS